MNKWKDESSLRHGVHVFGGKQESLSLHRGEDERITRGFSQARLRNVTNFPLWLMA